MPLKCLMFLSFTFTPCYSRNNKGGHYLLLFKMGLRYLYEMRETRILILDEILDIVPKCHLQILPLRCPKLF